MSLIIIIIIIIIIINIASIYCDFNVIVALAVLASLKLQPFAPINVKPGGRGGGRRAWGGDLIVFVVPGVGYLTDLVLPGEGIFESFFTRRGDI